MLDIPPFPSQGCVDFVETLRISKGVFDMRIGVRITLQRFGKMKLLLCHASTGGRKCSSHRLFYFFFFNNFIVVHLMSIWMLVSNGLFRTWGDTFPCCHCMTTFGRSPPVSSTIVKPGKALPAGLVRYEGKRYIRFIGRLVGKGSI